MDNIVMKMVPEIKNVTDFANIHLLRPVDSPYTGVYSQIITMPKKETPKLVACTGRFRWVMGETMDNGKVKIDNEKSNCQLSTVNYPLNQMVPELSFGDFDCEKNELVANCDRLVKEEYNLRIRNDTSSYGYRRYMPYVFTEQGVVCNG